MLPNFICAIVIKLIKPSANSSLLRHAASFQAQFKLQPIQKFTLKVLAAESPAGAELEVPKQSEAVRWAEGRSLAPAPARGTPNQHQSHNGSSARIHEAGRSPHRGRSVGY